MITWDIIEILTERFFLGRGHSNKFFWQSEFFVFKDDIWLRQNGINEL